MVVCENKALNVTGHVVGKTNQASEQCFAEGLFEMHQHCADQSVYDIKARQERLGSR